MLENTVFNTLPAGIQEKLMQAGIQKPTLVQEKVIPAVSAGQNTVFQSETGTGKTFAYLLPLLQRITELNESGQNVNVIICAPTFELASQIKQTAMTVSDIKTALFIGGAPLKRQVETLKEKPQIVIGTPARLLELIQLKKLKTSHVFAAVFDEADRLVKKELYNETAALLRSLPPDVQKIACTATVDAHTKHFFSDCGQIILPAENVLTKNIEHWAVYAESRDKIETLRKFLLAEKPEKTLVFTSRADQVENIRAKLAFRNIECTALHAKTDKQLRKSAIDRFKSGKIKILVTSDLSARGLDIQNVTHIIQMDFPSDSDFFVHRAGRTARAGKKGINVVIGDEYEMRKYALLEKKLGITVFPKEVRNGKVSSPVL